MNITYDKGKKLFHLTTNNSSYIIGIVADGVLAHIYYGKKVSEISTLAGLFDMQRRCPLSALYDKEFPGISTAILPQEYAVYGSTDYRTPTLKVEYADGSKITRPVYKSHRIYDGKPKLKGLPAVYTESDNEAKTLEIELKDLYSDMTVLLRYTVMRDYDAIIRSTEIVNNGKSRIKLKDALSVNVDYMNNDMDITYLSGTWARERHIERIPISHGNFVIDSKRGASSHERNPFIALSSKNADEKNGDVYGYSLVYSGSFVAGVESDSSNMARVYMGINPFDFCWNLDSGESFQTPEVVMVYSDNGFGDMSRTYHKLYRTRLCRGKYRDEKRPVLINNWEATYFDFNEEKIINIAKKAVECGVELFVLDDGWFGKRNNDRCSLGDWIVNKDKLPSGVSGLAEKVNALGMKFGLWFEPEMVSPDSDLYRAHPDWCLYVKDRKRSEKRNQLILDLSRSDVCEYIVNAVSDVLKSANISYVKWDMNRNMSEVGSAVFDGEHQSEIAHRYMLGLYAILEKITTDFPDILFESCSGGGGRFDPGMMYYMPQAWTSDDTDAVERLYIQHGTSLVYSASMMGAHVSAVPNHQVGRTTPLKMRGHVAMCGRFGYELDLSSLTDKETELVKQQINSYHEYEEIIHKGNMYRLESPFEHNYVAWQFVSENGDDVLLFYFNIKGVPLAPYTRIRLDGLDAKAEYCNVETGDKYFGDVLMNMGLFKNSNYDNMSELMVFKKVKDK